MNAHMICILVVGLLLNASLLTAREIRQEHFSLLSETVQLTDQETFVLTSIPSLRQPACGERTRGAIQGCQLPVVHFQLGSAELSQTEEDSLLAALAHYTVAPGTTGFIVTGHSCSLGTENRNLILSQQRADQVAAVLRAHGYTVSDVKGMGSRQPLRGTELANNRRVELALTHP